MYYSYNYAYFSCSVVHSVVYGCMYDISEINRLALPMCTHMAYVLLHVYEPLTFDMTLWFDILNPWCFVCVYIYVSVYIWVCVSVCSMCIIYV